MAVTGHVEEEYVKKAKDCGIDKVIPKPFPIGILGLILKDLNFINEIPPHLVEDCNELEI